MLPRAVRRWYSGGTVQVCLLASAVLLETTRALYRLGLVGPVRVGQMLQCSSRLTQVALRAWRSLSLLRSK